MTAPSTGADGRGSSTSVVIVNYNSAVFLGDCLRSLAGEPVERILVVDNGSREQDRDELVRVAGTDERVQLVLSAENLGFGAGVNLGVRHLDPGEDDVVVVLNPDTRVPTGALTALTRALDDGDLDVVNPVIYTGGSEQAVVWFAGGRLDLRAGETVHDGIDETGPVQVPTAQTSFVTGAALAMTGRTWQELGGFAEELFLYWEDADLSLRATAAGKRLGVVGDAALWHAQGGSDDDPGQSVAYYYYMQRNRILVLRPVVGLRRLLAGPGARFVLRTVVRALREPRDRWRKTRYSLIGLRDGIRGRTGHRPLV